jgi:hypothetical protein
MTEATSVLADPTAYADDERLRAGSSHLRASGPVAWVDHPPNRPFLVGATTFVGGRKHLPIRYSIK